MMDIIKYAACFVRARVSNNVVTEVINGSGMVRSKAHGAISTTETMYNFTSREVTIVHADGREYSLPPINADGQNHQIYEMRRRYGGHFIIVKSHDTRVSVKKTKLEVKDSNNRSFNIHEGDIEIANNHQYEDGAVKALLTSIHEDDIHRSRGGIALPSMCITVGFNDHRNYTENKIAMLFPNKGKSAPAAGVRVIARVCRKTIKNLFVVMGTHIFPVTPTHVTDDSDVIIILRTNADGEEVELDGIDLDDALNGNSSDLKAYETRREAEMHVKDLKEANDNYLDVRAKNKEQAEKIDELNRKAKRLEDDLKNEKNATKQAKTNNSTSKWSKASAIIGTIFGVVSSLIALALKFL